ncbi:MULTISPECIES: EamA family transporter [unclassified Aeromicrobium]|uniref:EamA family transporter n=1 Tax=unclassified Aeromicrobium TaxID=2633570 RepID=UPI00396B08DC
MKLGREGLSAAQVMVGRLGLGSMLLIAIMLVTRRRWPRGARTWGSLAVIAVFLCVIPFTLYAWAGQRIPSSLSSIYNATTPIATLMVGLALLPDELLTRFRIGGLLIAACGVVVVAGPWAIDVGPLMAPRCC